MLDNALAQGDQGISSAVRLNFVSFDPLKTAGMDAMKENIDLGRLPAHIAIIMDGNGRWAREQGQDRLFGHYHGVESVRNIVEGCAELGIGYLTLYAFSTENWDRPEYEVTGLMELLVETIQREVDTLNKNQIRLHVIGDMHLLPDYARKELNEALESTAGGGGAQYGARCAAGPFGPRQHLPGILSAIPLHPRISGPRTDDPDQRGIPDQQFPPLSTSLCGTLFYSGPLARFSEGQSV
jgi:hypothetical protein